MLSNWMDSDYVSRLLAEKKIVIPMRHVPRSKSFIDPRKTILFKKA